jgi:predicted nuclease of restriction endonuclease-like (RecB) superfamily
MKLQNDFSLIFTLIQASRLKAIQSVNKELIKLYWEIGKYITEKSKAEGWGKSTVDNLSDFIKKQDATLTGFTPRNIWRMKQFYESYSNYPNLSPLVTDLSWSNNLMILSKAKNIEEREFYIRLSIRERYSKRELERQINSSVFERTVLLDKKLPPSTQQFPKDIAGIFKDTYVLEFLNLPKVYDERDLQKAILRNLKDFLLELGKDFTFFGEEVRIQVGKHDYFIDLVFYHRELQCLVALELKMQEFQPSFLGQLNFYLEALDSDIRKPHENPSIGILLCKGKDDEVVEYALRRNLSPTLIADYEMKLIDKKVLQQKLHQLVTIFEQEK